MTPLLAAAASDTAVAFIEIGALAIALAAIARVASRLGITAIPFYLLAGLALGEGGIAQVSVSSDFISLAAEIGVLLLLLTLGLEYTAAELRAGLRSSARPGLVDAVVNFTPGFAAGILLGWGATTAFLLGGITWISSSGVVAKLLNDLDRLGFRETPAVLNLLVVEDLAMALYLPVVAALVTGQALGPTMVTVVVALAAVGLILWSALRFGHQLSALLAPGNDEAVLLSVFGTTLLVAGVAQRLQVSAAIGAFLVGLALSGPVQARASDLIRPLRDLFAATFFLFFSFQIDARSVVAALVPALALALVTSAGKLVSGWVAAAGHGSGPRGRLRAGTALIARGEFSIVIASIGSTLAPDRRLSALAAAYVLVTAIFGPVVAMHADRLRIPGVLARRAQPRISTP